MELLTGVDLARLSVQAISRRIRAQKPYRGVKYRLFGVEFQRGQEREAIKTLTDGIVKKRLRVFAKQWPAFGAESSQCTGRGVSVRFVEQYCIESNGFSRRLDVLAARAPKRKVKNA